jgi:predicted AAA+ superfamily ATPase
MKEIISNSEIKYIKRRIAPKIREIVENFPVVVITGARQVGKSTLLKNEFQDFTYLTMDDFALREKARLDPQSLWKDSDKVVIDEAQKLPQIFDAIKMAVDDSDRRRKFILSGSANLLLMEKVTETLAGRALYFELLPMTFGEEKGFLTAEHFLGLWDKGYNQSEQIVGEHDPLPMMLRGFMPPLLTLKEYSSILYWLEGYVKTYLERDLRELTQVDSLIDFRKVMQGLALRTGHTLNQADIARMSGSSHATAHRYIRILEISNIIQRIPAYFVNRNKRLVKSPKVFYVDPAISIFLAGYHDAESLMKSRELGHFFETLVYLHIRALCELVTPKAGLYYWRTVSGREIDFVVERGRRLLAIEVKYTSNPTAYDIKNLLEFMNDYPETIRGVLVHSGDGIKWLHSKVIAVPWWWLDI